VIGIQEKKEHQESKAGKYGKAHQPDKKLGRPATFWRGFENHPDQSDGDHGHEIGNASHQQRIAPIELKVFGKGFEEAISINDAGNWCERPVCLGQQEWHAQYPQEQFISIHDVFLLVVNVD
jgi:hypothetical protein